MYAIVEVKGKQYKVEEGNTITTDMMEGQVGDKVSLDKVLLIKDDTNVRVGTPYVEGVSVAAEITAQGRGPKVRVSKFKAKVRYRRTTGHRHSLTDIKVISLGGKKTEVAKEKKEVKKIIKAKKNS